MSQSSESDPNGLNYLQNYYWIERTTKNSISLEFLTNLCTHNSDWDFKPVASLQSLNSVPKKVVVRVVQYGGFVRIFDGTLR
jgi:hypothetical protein